MSNKAREILSGIFGRREIAKKALKTASSKNAIKR